MSGVVVVVSEGGRKLPLLLLLLVAVVGVVQVGVTTAGFSETADVGGTTTEGGGGEEGTGLVAAAAAAAAAAATLKGGGKVSPSLRTGAWHATQNNRWPSERGEATKGVLHPGTGQMSQVSFQPSCNLWAMSVMMRCLFEWQGDGEEGVGCCGLEKEATVTQGEDTIVVAVERLHGGW